ncbi:hypothetical protein PSQ20_21810 [Curvibacter sp. RS43]|uniref:TubC N-terminal docking domain-related protein n=1 Tax=Curvibacter microcysteis TaxID=3026419 RepID=UPI002360792A|nr:hypothetical protein [Curvibacter sp. RS43]MDD0812987.1 hypothetical protein [Curvibacter sp. RS43]
MTPQTILSNLIASGIYLDLSPDEKNLHVPAGSLTPEQRHLITEHKASLLDYLREAKSITSELLAVSMRVCDRHQDSERARADMREQVLQTPLSMRMDLLDHFKEADGGSLT